MVPVVEATSAGFDVALGLVVGAVGRDVVGSGVAGEAVAAGEVVVGSAGEPCLPVGTVDGVVVVDEVEFVDVVGAFGVVDGEDCSVLGEAPST